MPRAEWSGSVDQLETALGRIVLKVPVEVPLILC